MHIGKTIYIVLLWDQKKEFHMMKYEEDHLPQFVTAVIVSFRAKFMGHHQTNIPASAWPRLQ